MKTPKTIIIVGNHHTPAIELIRQLQTDPNTDWQIHYLAHVLSSETHLSHTIIPQLKINFHPINSGKFDRRFIGKTLLGIPLTIAGIFQSLFLIYQIKPQIVVSFGAYVSVPVIIAAKILRIKSIIHEQTLTNSLTTRFCAGLVDKVALSFKHLPQIKQLPKNKVVITGNLLRQEIFSYSQSNSQFSKFVSSSKPLIYITGGNQGSSAINQIIKELMPDLRQYNLIHQTGPLEYSQFSKLKNSHYFPIEYVNSTDIGWILHHAEVIISRAGANTCQELSALHKKSILIPFPYAQQNEQFLNAQWLQHQLPQSTIILDQFKLTPKEVLFSLQTLLKQPSPSSPPKSFSNSKLLKLIYELV